MPEDFRENINQKALIEICFSLNIYQLLFHFIYFVFKFVNKFLINFKNFAFRILDLYFLTLPNIISLSADISNLNKFFNFSL